MDIEITIVDDIARTATGKLRLGVTDVEGASIRHRAP
jgi:hypothetical protein